MSKYRTIVIKEIFHFSCILGRADNYFLKDAIRCLILYKGHGDWECVVLFHIQKCILDITYSNQMYK